MQFVGSKSVRGIFILIPILILLIVLSVDELNPVKVVCGLFNLPDWYIAAAAAVVLAFTSILFARDIIYQCMRIFFRSILSIFFKKIELVGLENIPEEGPVIFTGNHANQFADGVIVMMTCKRKVGFIIARKSMNIPLIGFFAKISGCIPVVRPQDVYKQGTGSISLSSDKSKDKYTYVGEGTEFTREICPGDQIRIRGNTVSTSGNAVKVLKVVSDTEVVLAKSLTAGGRHDELAGGDHYNKHGAGASKGSVSVNGDGADAIGTGRAKFKFDLLPKLDQAHMFREVYQHLAAGQCIGIFPEGGSHDRTDLLPLKVGLAVMVFGAREHEHVNVPVVPVGLNYFRGHRFRAQCIVEFGEPIVVTKDELQEYRRDRRTATGKFLHRVAGGMRSVLVTATDYDSLQTIYTARRLFQPNNTKLSARTVQDQNRRFAEGFKILMAKYGEDAAVLDLRRRIDEYRYQLKTLGLKDHQVPLLRYYDARSAFGTLIYALTIFVLTSFPTLVLNAPVGLFARWAAKHEREKALKGSRVKIHGRDVMLSKKIMVSIIGVPLLWIAYAILLVTTTSLPWNVTLLIFLSCPLFSYFGVITTEAGMVALSDLKPLAQRLRPSFRNKQDELSRLRVHLQQDLREFIHAHKDDLGELYFQREIDWSKYMVSRDTGPFSPEVGGSDAQAEPALEPKLKSS